MASAQDLPYATISFSDDSNDPISLTFSGWFEERHQPPREPLFRPSSNLRQVSVDPPAVEAPDDW